MKKKTGKRLLCLLLMCVMAFTPAASQAAVVSNFGVTYNYNEDGTKRTGIHDVTIDSMEYYDIFGGDKEADRSQGRASQFLKYALVNPYDDESGITPLQYWSDLAYAIFAANSDYSARKSLSNFGAGVSNSGGNGDVAALLNRTSSYSSTTSNHSDLTRATGLTYANSLKAVRDEAYSLVAGDIDRNATASWIEGKVNDGKALESLNDETDQTVYYSIVHCLDNVDGLLFRYNVFGVAFHDFEVQVIANDKLDYITAAEGYSSLEEAASQGVNGVSYDENSESSNVTSYFQNGSKESADIGMELTQSNSMEVSNAFSSSTSYSWSSMVGSETSLSLSLSKLAKVTETLKMEFTTGETISTGYTNTESVSKETTSQVSENITLPAQSAVVIESSSDETQLMLDYDCPVAIKYKVTIFAMSGDIYDDGIKTKSMTTGGYWQSYFSTTFGDTDIEAGTDAVSNLYARAVERRYDAGYEKSHGNTYGWTKKKGGSASEVDELNWDNILAGIINASDLQPDTIDIEVDCYEVDQNGNLIIDQEVDNDGNVIDETQRKIFTYRPDTKGLEDQETVIEAPKTVSSGGITYNLYTGTVLDPNTDTEYNLNDRLSESSGKYYKSFLVYQDPEKDPNTDLDDDEPEIDFDPVATVRLYYTAPADDSVTPLNSLESETEAAEEDEAAESEEIEAAAAEAEVIEAEEPVETEEAAPETEAIETAESEEIEEAAAEAEVIEAEEPVETEEAAPETEAIETAEPEKIEEPVAEVEVIEAEEPLENEEGAAESETIEVAEPVAVEDYTAEADPVEPAVPEEPAESVENEAYADGELIIEDGGTIQVLAGVSTAAPVPETEESLTIESIEVVEEEEIPEELRIKDSDEEEGFSLEVYTVSQTDNAVTTYASKPDIDAEVSWLVTHTPMSIMGGTVSASAKSMNSEIYGIEPIYPLNSIKVVSDQLTFNIISGDTMNVDNIVLDGFNKEGVAYYGFEQELGYWVLTDSDGKELSSSEVASIETDPYTGETLLVAGEEGTVYLKYMIDETAAKYSYINNSSVVKNEDLESTAIVKVNVVKGPFNGTVTASGTLTGYANETDDDYVEVGINLDNCDTISATVYDETDKKISDPAITWEAQETEEDGIRIENNRLYFTEPGTYHIRAIYGYSTINNDPYYSDCYSNWIEITALPEKVLNELTIEDITDPVTLSDIILGDGYETINLGWLTYSGEDQYGLDWTKLENLKWYVDGEEVEPNDAGSYLYTATEAGTHIIYAECADPDGKYDVKSNELTMTVLAERELSSLQISDTTSPKTLAEVTYGEGKENVDLSKLKITALDQYGDTWTDLDNLKWYVDDQALSGTVYTVKDTSAGTHSIYAQCDGIKSNKLSISVKVPATSVKLNKETLEIKDGKTKQLKATMAPTGTTDTVTWTSSNKKVATVSADGTVTAVSAGTATITAKTTSGKTATCQVHAVYKKNETFTKGSYKYIVKNASTDGTGEVYMNGFAKGKSKKKLTVPDTVTVNGTTYKVTAIANEAFKGNKTIKSVTTGKNLTTIGKSAFEDCQSLKTVTIGNSVKKINFKAFFDCYNLKTLSIGKNVNFMGAHCFCNDSKLKTITIKTTKLKSKNVESPHVFINVNNATMKVPKSKYSSYKKLFTNRYYGGKITKKKQ